jgi:hypothetical protein
MGLFEADPVDNGGEILGSPAEVGGEDRECGIVIQMTLGFGP